MLEKIEEVYSRIKDTINHTPVVTSTTLNNRINAKCFLKMESYQRTGSFKIRGALNAITCLSEEHKAKGVTTHSSGNFAQALSLAANMAEVKATVVMPDNAPKIKVAATKGYGAEVVFCGTKPGDREEKAQSLIDEHGYTLIHSSNDMDIIYGQSTATYELIKEVGELDYVLAPCGGGGLLSGTAIATKSLCPEAKVIGVEPKNADDAFRSFRDGKIYPSINPNTIADGLRTSLGSNTFRVVQKYVDEIITVSEEEIVDAMEFLWARMKHVVEPSGAVSLAGVLSSNIDLQNKRVGIIISGGNIDVTQFINIIRSKIE
ncbi:MAG: threonine/serine dehydratase [Candidatus Heimdallarchaeota archaeon]|nr:threonine/serine dehydratase [Candidatus Heimdallarchaeota archaeon]MCK4770788.1 threonine/serine dehydratase [Candidatus Heimdallarchaeota archaeon]